MRRAVVGAASASLLLLTPATASAHGIVGRQDLPIPVWLFGWGAAVVLVLSFVALATLWTEPRLENAGDRVLFSVPLIAEVVAGAIGVGLFALVVYAGLSGSQVPVDNIAPTAVYVAFWTIPPVLGLMFGDVFAALSPWRAIGRATGWVAKRLAGDSLPDPLAYPQRIGHWPAAATIFAFTWVELAYSENSDPSTLAILALAYMALQLVGMSLYGVQAWTAKADGFGVLFGLYGRLSAIFVKDRRLRIRRLLSGITSFRPGAGTIALLCVAIGSTSFDGFSQGTLWAQIVPHLQSFFGDLGLNQRHALEAAFTVGLTALCLFVALIYWLGVQGMKTVESGHAWRELAPAFVHSLVPISLAYVVAHYFSLVAYQGQDLWRLASDPLGDGSDIFGTASRAIDYSVVGANGIWYVQVGALVAGHVLALALAHDRALVVYQDGRAATRSQYWMLAVMVGFTSLGLWLLSATAQA